ncbi:PREDICTED: transcription elongation factor B polypeptide 3-like [Elephantulus edwardii]|uniref:transcription elongation factor B polypeptide 3-like n=1 Tax=Elephantulus edwardii TaxID=28737 RepID=UPI0003F0CB4D|nr:PREDICTED: transcription elongation factor B polypeptide 3-like [Elephantulus edwardii]
MAAESALPVVEKLQARLAANQDPKKLLKYLKKLSTLPITVDILAETGVGKTVNRVPYHLLEPVLERCTPSQLYRIEECNHVLIEDTDQLWKIHCHRDFKEERPEEYESWREMYLRLHDAREQRLRLVTQKIQSAHANKPKGRQAKMAFVNSVAKPPRDVRRRQEKFGTGGAAVPDRIKIKPALDLTGSSHTSFSSGSSNSSHPSNGPKIAPMMAKTIKAFKNRFSRR